MIKTKREFELLYEKLVKGIASTQDIKEMIEYQEDTYNNGFKEISICLMLSALNRELVLSMTSDDSKEEALSAVDDSISWNKKALSLGEKSVKYGIGELYLIRYALTEKDVFYDEAIRWMDEAYNEGLEIDVEDYHEIKSKWMEKRQNVKADNEKTTVEKESPGIITLLFGVLLILLGIWLSSWVLGIIGGLLIIGFFVS